jgi:nitric oxide reductase NorE protein
VTTINRPAEAPSAPIARADDARRIPGELGTWLFIGGELLVFAVLFVAYLEVRAEQPRAFTDAQGSLSLALGTVNTVVLLTSSWLAAAVPRALAAGDRAAARGLVRATLACGLLFVVLKSAEWIDKVGSGATPASGDFFMWYFVLTGLHMLHVLVGLGALLFVLRALRRQPDPAVVERDAESAVSYWHLVDLLWVALFPLLYFVH